MDPDEKVRALEERVAALEAAISELGGVTRVAHLQVERLDVVEADGTLRLVATSTERCPAPIMDGRSASRSGGGRAGLIFYNDVGDECGGLVFGGISQDDPPGGDAHALLAFDQWKHDQSIGLTYSHGGDRHEASLRVWDHPDPNLWEFVDAIEAAQALPDGEEKTTRLAALKWGFERVVVGRNLAGDAELALADGAGRIRMRLVVEAGGSARIETYDEHGDVAASLPRAPARSLTYGLPAL